VHHFWGTTPAIDLLDFVSPSHGSVNILQVSSSIHGVRCSFTLIHLE
jgi:hypothetical protein